MKAHPFNRRLFTGALLSIPWIANAQPDPVAGLLRAGGCIVLLRHAQTEPGIGDPPGVQIELCSTQRNLSDEGRAQARRIGQWFVSRSLKPAAVQSSAWCRCMDTASLAFAQYTVWPALNAPPDDRERTMAQTALVRKALSLIPTGRFEVWVTHQGNITNLTGGGVGMGEAMIVNVQGKVITQTAFV